MGDEAVVGGVLAFMVGAILFSLLPHGAQVGIVAILMIGGAIPVFYFGGRALLDWWGGREPVRMRRAQRKMDNLTWNSIRALDEMQGK